MGEGVAGEMGSFCWEGSGFRVQGSEKPELADCYTGSSAALNGWGGGRCLEESTRQWEGERSLAEGGKSVR